MQVKEDVRKAVEDSINIFAKGGEKRKKLTKKSNSYGILNKF